MIARGAKGFLCVFQNGTLGEVFPGQVNRGMAMNRGVSKARATFVVVALLMSSGLAARGQEEGRHLRPWPDNPRYWQYEGRPVRLVGGSKDDNLFQLPDLKQHLDEIKAAGGNYVRNTMSDRPDKGFEVYPFAKRDDGKYDLSKWNDEYWNRFERFLALTAERDIIVQIEVWDRFDYTDVRQKNWQPHPYNPANNVNYSYKESGFAKEYPDHPGRNKQPFFFTPPSLDDNRVVLPFQRAQVDKMLSYSLKHPHVLYCIDNETSGKEEWATYWAEHIRQRAKEAGVDVCITEMWDDWNVKGGRHLMTFDHPQRYVFVDISQNAHNRGQEHWDNLMWVRDYVAKRPRPINHVKIYGADGGRHGGGDRDAVEKLWRNLIGGAASARFHRPDSGIGLNELASRHIRAFRMLEAECDLFGCEPDADSQRLSKRDANEAYLTCLPGQEYVLYFPGRGDVSLDLKETQAPFRVRWLDIEAGRWIEADAVPGGSNIRLASPVDGHAVCLVQRK